MNVRYYLESRGKDPKMIYLYINSLGIKLYTKQKIPASKWDSKKQRGKGTFNLNQLLDTLERICIETIQANVINNKYTTKEDIVNSIANQTALFKKKDPVNTFYIYAHAFAESNSKWSKGYINQFYSWLNNFNEKYPNITFDKFDYVFYRTYRNEGLKTYKTNTFAGHWKKFKRVLDDALYSGIVLDQSYKKIKIGSEPSHKIYLTSYEVNHWYSNLHTLSGQHLNASALFLIGCFSGMRFSDFKDVKSNKIYHEGQLYYRVQTKKTTTVVTIPGNDQLTELLSMDLHEISNQKMNQYLKEAADILGINEEVYINNEKVAKCNLVQTHTARRTFATNAYLEGIPINFIMSITGHKTEKEFRKYIKIDDIKNAIEFNKYKKPSTK